VSPIYVVAVAMMVIAAAQAAVSVVCYRGRKGGREGGRTKTRKVRC